jgi:hypothetical protein
MYFFNLTILGDVAPLQPVYTPFISELKVKPRMLLSTPKPFPSTFQTLWVSCLICHILFPSLADSLFLDSSHWRFLLTDFLSMPTVVTSHSDFGHQRITRSGLSGLGPPNSSQLFLHPVSAIHPSAQSSTTTPLRSHFSYATFNTNS